MTGYQSKRAAALDKLEQWDTPSGAFNEWWNNDYDDSTNPFEVDTYAYWAFAGWHAALAQPAPVQEFGLTLERFNALEAEITTLQADWLFALKEVVRLKAAQREQELWAGVDFDIKLTPPHRPWVDLTEKQIEVIEEIALTKQWAIRMALTAVKEKNA